MNVFVGTNKDMTLLSKTPEIALGKWPNLYPTLFNLGWTSYSDRYQNFTISAWDPDFDGINN
jgi:hypothetical protein